MPQWITSMPANAGIIAGDLASIPGSEDPLEEEMATHYSILVSHGQRSLARLQRVRKRWEQLSTHTYLNSDIHKR